MKFHCDRCKTRYSISDERVRGKILKIRCKNCSAVITVREGMPPPKPREPARSAPPGPRPSGEASRGGPDPRAPSPAAGPSSQRARRGSALEGAFQQVIKAPAKEPDAADSLSDAPAALDTEWYVAIDGEQSGPFTLAEAQAWVTGQSVEDDAYCWSEGFDDWLPVDKVGHFRGLRRAASEAGSPLADDAPTEDQTVIGPPPVMDDEEPAPAVPQPQPAGAPRPLAAAPAAASQWPSPRPAPEPARGPGSGPVPAGAPSPAGVPPDEKTPQPLFAATMAAVAAEAPTMEEQSRKNGSSRASDFLQMPPPGDRNGQSAEARGGDVDLDIGEASRVVRLPVPPAGGLAQPQGVAPGFGRGSGSHGALPGVGAGTPSAFGPDLHAPRPEVLQPRRRSGLLVPLLIAGVVLAGVAIVLVILATGDEPSGDGEYVARTGVADEDLAQQFSNPIKKQVAKEEGEGDDSEGGSAGKNHGAGKVSGRSHTRTAGRKTHSQVPTGEVDLSGSTSGEEAVVQGYLDPGEVGRVAKKYRFLTQRCYERALKKDPLLDVPKTNVFITVSPGGRVSKVSIPSLSGQLLGTCLRSAIKRWKFPKSTKGLSTSFPLLFR